MKGWEWCSTDRVSFSHRDDEVPHSVDTERHASGGNTPCRSQRSQGRRRAHPRLCGCWMRGGGKVWSVWFFFPHTSTSSSSPTVPVLVLMVTVRTVALSMHRYEELYQVPVLRTVEVRPRGSAGARCRKLVKRFYFLFPIRARRNSRVFTAVAVSPPGRSAARKKNEILLTFWGTDWYLYLPVHRGA